MDMASNLFTLTLTFYKHACVNSLAHVNSVRV